MDLMISSSSDASISCDILPIRDHAFLSRRFSRLGQCLLELTDFGAQALQDNADLVLG
jgi:hypothetical protein